MAAIKKREAAPPVSGHILQDAYSADAERAASFSLIRADLPERSRR